jgi:hypothetical protein
VGFGSKPIPQGHLPVFSVADEEEALELLTLACQTNVKGEFVATELAEEQTLENLNAFSDRLQLYHDQFLVPHGTCRCKEISGGKGVRKGFASSSVRHLQE